MIRFVDLRGQKTGSRFAFFDTVSASFLKLGEAQCWDDLADLMVSTKHGCATCGIPIEQLVALLPEWAKSPGQDVDSFTVLISSLGLDQAPSDSVRARVLSALRTYGERTDQPDISKAAEALMPAAHPFEPPAEWVEQYRGTFESVADPDCGVDPDESHRYSAEYWQSLTDADRKQRLANPSLGREDGQKDADNLNAA
ncbi:hypothetical protein [Paucibacter soli]|uniref:hypothetical protein n=1 Tax=Paucibacter soli TaxID=3133433 RepID=UPI0030B25B58